LLYEEEQTAEMQDRPALRGRRKKNSENNLHFMGPPLSLHSQVLKTQAEVAQLVEHHLAKVGVAGSNLVFRSLDSIPLTQDGIFVCGCLIIFMQQMPWWRNR
jgi:hypothetical protein